MKKIIIFIFIFSNSLSCMEKPQELLIAPLGLPKDVWSIVARKLLQDPSDKQAAQNFFSLARTSKYFAQLSREPGLGEALAQDFARYFPEELDAICPYDLIFAAAYRLNTKGAKQWIKDEYLKEPRNFKIISKNFLRDIDGNKKRSGPMQQFIKEIFPATIPPLIHQRIYRFVHYDGYMWKTDDPMVAFLKSLAPTADTSINSSATLSLLRALDRSRRIAAQEIMQEIENALKDGADPDAETPDGHIPLNLAFDISSDAVKLLLDYGANANNRARLSGAPLILAQDLSRYRDRPMLYKVTQLLLAAGANPNTQLYGSTPLTTAVGMNNAPIELLLQAGANPNKPQIGSFPPDVTLIRYPLESAIYSNHKEHLKLLLAAGAKTSIKIRGLTPAELALSLRNTEIASILMEHDNEFNSGTETPQKKARLHKKNKNSGKH